MGGCAHLASTARQCGAIPAMAKIHKVGVILVPPQGSTCSRVLLHGCSLSVLLLPESKDFALRKMETGVKFAMFFLTVFDKDSCQGRHWIGNAIYLPCTRSCKPEVLGSSSHLVPPPTSALYREVRPLQLKMPAYIPMGLFHEVGSPGSDTFMPSHFPRVTAWRLCLGCFSPEESHRQREFSRDQIEV